MYPRNDKNLGNVPPPAGAYGQAWRGQSVHAGAPPPMQSARARARNGKQNAPRTSSCSSRSRVVRFVSRFFRARGHVLSLSGAPGGVRCSKFCIKSISWLGKKYPVLPADLVIFSCPWVSQKNRGGASWPGQLLDIKYYCPKPRCLCSL